MVEETRRKIGPAKLIVYNGLMRENREKLLRATDGAMEEHFGHFANGSSKEQIFSAIEATQAAKARSCSSRRGRASRIVSPR